MTLTIEGLHTHCVPWTHILPVALESDARVRTCVCLCVCMCVPELVKRVAIHVQADNSISSSIYPHESWKQMLLCGASACVTHSSAEAEYTWLQALEAMLPRHPHSLVNWAADPRQKSGHVSRMPRFRR